MKKITSKFEKRVKNDHTDLIKNKASIWRLTNVGIRQIIYLLCIEQKWGGGVGVGCCNTNMNYV